MRSLKYLVLAGLFISACDKKNDDLVNPLVEQNFPQILLLSDEGDGELEDEDKFSFKITLADRVDETGKELGGKVVPLEKDVTVNFEISKLKGFTVLSDYILDAKAFYEIDDCTTSEDQNIDLKLVIDKKTGKGSVTFPKGVEEIEIEFETDDSLFDDKVFNEKERGLEIKLTTVTAHDQTVVVNDQLKFEYRVLDDEGIYGEYELDVKDASQFQNYLNLFSLASDKLKGLRPGDVEEIKVEFQYGEFKAIVVLKETQEVRECGETETQNKEIEIEGDLEDLEDDKLSGDIEIVGSVELENGKEEEFVYKGSFKINNGRLELALKGELDDEETSKITLSLKK